MIVKLCDADDLPDEGEMKSFAGTDGLQICVAALNREGKQSFAAFNNRCPHQSAPLSAGRMEGCTVVCPYHGWRFDVVTGRGENIADPDLEVYELRRYGEEVFIRLPDSR